MPEPVRLPRGGLPDWFGVRFSEAEVDEAKRLRVETDAQLRFHHFDSERRYAGYLGEIAGAMRFRVLSLSFEWYSTRSPMELIDFVVEGRRVDCKTACTEFFPRLDYGANVVEGQCGRSEVEVYTFCRYIVPSRIVVVMGGIEAREFLDRASRHKKGEWLNKMRVPEDMRMVPVGSLIDLDTLFCPWTVETDNGKLPVWALVDNGKASGGIAVSDGIVRDACPYFRFLIGLRLTDALRQVRLVGGDNENLVGDS